LAASSEAERELLHHADLGDLAARLDIFVTKAGGLPTGGPPARTRPSTTTRMTPALACMAVNGTHTMVPPLTRGVRELATRVADPLPPCTSI